MIEKQRPDLSPDEAHLLQERIVADLAEGKAEQSGEKKGRRAAAKISLEEHLAGLWNVLGLGD